MLKEQRRNFTIRLSEKEEEMMKVSADANRLNPSEYVRELILHGGTVDRTFATDYMCKQNSIVFTKYTFHI